MSYAKGIMWLDDCRIPFVDDADIQSATQFGNTDGVKIYGRNSYNESKSIFEEKPKPSPLGRFTPNLLVCDDMLNDGSVSNSSGGKGEATKNSLDRTDIGFGYKKLDDAPGLGGYGDKGTNSRYYDLDLWFDKMLEKL